MKVKRFFSKSMQDVLKQVREDLGPDAVILSNSRVDDGIEVVAALDYEEGMLEQETIPEKVESGLMEQGKPSPSHLARMHAERHLQLQKEMERAKRRIEEVKHQKAKVAPIQEVAEPAPVNEPEPVAKKPAWDELSDMRSELQELKSMITQTRGGHPVVQQKPAMTLLQDQVLKSLSSLGLAEHLRDNLVKQVAGEMDFGVAWQVARQQLAASMNPNPAEIIDQGGVVALVGPTGSGKTMTIGKMAARYVMKYGADSIALVTTDRYRIAAHEQLKVFGRILNVPVYVVDDANPLDQVLDSLSQKKLVLVDTAGLLHTDSCWSEQLQELKLSRHRIQPYLTVSAVGQYQVMCANYHYYKIAGLAGAIITKIDEAVSLGEVISFLVDTRLRVAYYTDGQRVPEDIHLLDSGELLDKAEGLLNSSERWVTISSPEQESVVDAFYSFGMEGRSA